MSDGEVVEPGTVPGETTPTGAPKEKFGHGRAANAEAGAKGAEISMSRPKEAVQEASRKAARTRAERYGQQLHVSDPERDDLQDVPTTVKDTVGEVDVAASEKNTELHKMKIRYFAVVRLSAECCLNMP